MRKTTITIVVTFAPLVVHYTFLKKVTGKIYFQISDLPRPRDICLPLVLTAPIPRLRKSWIHLCACKSYYLSFSHISIIFLDPILDFCFYPVFTLQKKAEELC